MKQITRAAMRLVFCLTHLCSLTSSTIQTGSFVPNNPASTPSFIIIGTAKGGTTDLYVQLVDVAVNADPSRPDPPVKTYYEFTHRGRQKELGNLYKSMTFPDEWLLGRSEFMMYLNDLRHPCANVTLEVLRACVDAAGLQQYTFDATPGYLHSAIAAYNLAALSPLTKVIVMLRDPVDRSESLYYHWNKKELTHENHSLDSLVDMFYDHSLHVPGVAATLQRLQSCSSAACHASNWLDLIGLTDSSSTHWRIFFGALYTYALGTWRSAYLQPGRMMVIDSHAFYRNRSAVMEQVIFFLYGRPMTNVEMELAAGTYIANSGSSRYQEQQAVINSTNVTTAPAAAAASDAKPWWQLSPQNRARLQAFYQQHLHNKLQLTLQELRDEGAWVVGFDQEPWVAATASAGQETTS